MDNDNKDTIDLIPYYKLIRRTISGVSSWFKRNIVLILIVFIAFMGFKIYNHVFGVKKFMYTGIIDREYISIDDLSSVLKSTSRKIKVPNEKGTDHVVLNSENLLDRLLKLEYNLVLNLKDEVVNNSSKKIDSIQIDYDVPMEVSLFTITLIDSIGEQFVGYLNEHPYILKLREEHLSQWEVERNELIDKINFIDTIIVKSQTGNEIKNINRDYFNFDQSTELFELVRYKNELIDELTLLEFNLEKAKKADIFIVDGFKSAEQVEKTDFTSIIFYLKYLVYSCLIVLIVSQFLNKLIRR